METEKIFTGLIDDPRTEEQKARDFKHEEIASAATLVYVEKPQSEWKKYSMRDQDGSSSCVSQAAAKAMEIKREQGIAISAHPIYRRRANFPSEGMWLQDAAEIVKKHGTTTEALDPSQFLGEVQMNREITVVTPLKEPVYITVEHPKDIDTIAAIIQKHGQCWAVFHANVNEWTQNVPTIIPGSVANIGHCICFTDFFMYEGQKALLADESWGKATTIGTGGQRVVKEEFLKLRFDGAVYFPKMNVPVEPEKPVLRFFYPLEYGMLHDSSVRDLQKMLTYEAFFPLGEEYHQGNFKEMTAWATRKWQISHGLMDFANETNPKKIRFGNKSIALANQLYKA